MAVVTGGGRGIGRATALRLAADGYAVVAVARTEDDLASLARESAAVVPCPGDVGDPADVERAASIAASRGRLRVWVNNAALLERMEFAELTPDRWRSTMRVDLDGVLFGCLAAFKRMRHDGGVIVNVASLSGVPSVEKFPGLAAYNVAKAGVIALTEAVALEGKPHGIRCVCVSPGAVDTEMLQVAAPHLRPGMTAQDMAAIIAFLITSEAAPLSGINIPIFSNE